MEYIVCGVAESLMIGSPIFLFVMIIVHLERMGIYSDCLFVSLLLLFMSSSFYIQEKILPLARENPLMMMSFLLFVFEGIKSVAKRLRPQRAFVGGVVIIFFNRFLMFLSIYILNFFGVTETSRFMMRFCVILSFFLAYSILIKSGVSRLLQERYETVPDGVEIFPSFISLVFFAGMIVFIQI